MLFFYLPDAILRWILPDVIFFSGFFASLPCLRMSFSMDLSQVYLACWCPFQWNFYSISHWKQDNATVPYY